MKSTRLIGLSLVALLALCPCAASLAQPGQSDWLLGTWNGELRDASGKVVARVTMKVTGIASDGTAEGRWGLFEDQLYKAK